MPIPAPGSAVLSDDVIDTQSPYWLRINGGWVQLQGVTPGSSLSVERPTSEFVSVDGVRYAQRAPRSNREWAMDWQYATPSAVAALAVAIDSTEDVWLFDGASAVANMLAPGDCYGHDDTAPTIDCGGIPLRQMEPYQEIATNVRGGTSVTVSAYTTAAPGTPTLYTTVSGTTLAMIAPAGTGVRRVSRVVAPADDGDLVLSTAISVSGLQVVEGDLPPTWLPGERTPCKVAVTDPSRTLNLLRSGSRGRSDYSVTLREVG